MGNVRDGREGERVLEERGKNYGERAWDSNPDEEDICEPSSSRISIM